MLELQYVDETGTVGATTVKYAIDTTYAVLEGEATAFASLIAPITGCKLSRVRIIYKAVAEPRDTPMIGSIVKRQGVFIFEDGTGGNQTLFAVPGFDESKLVASGAGSGVLIDTTDSDVSALIDAFTASGMVNPFGVECAAIIAAYLQSRA